MFHYLITVPRPTTPDPGSGACPAGNWEVFGQYCYYFATDYIYPDYETVCASLKMVDLSTQYDKHYEESINVNFDSIIIYCLLQSCIVNIF